MRHDLLSLGLVAGLCILLPANEPEKRLDVSPGQLLEVDLATGGSIQIRGGSENAVRVKSTLKGRNSDQIRVNTEKTKNGVRITSRYEGSSRSGGSATLEITVPSRFDVELKTMGGELDIQGVEGSLKGHTMGGAIRLSNLKGKLDLSTMGGAINLQSSQVDGKVSTKGGKILIKDVTGDIKGSSMGGDVVYENVQRPGGAEGKKVEIHTMGGDIRVASAKSGANLKTMGGAIVIDSAGDFVKATTMGGPIEIKELDGGVEAKTMGGPIKVNMVGDPAQGKRDVKLSSMGGEIQLTLPAALSMDIDVELEHTKDSWRSYKITSDFPLNITESPNWDSSNGSPRKTIKGVASVAGGKHKIIIRTINGNVIIKKR